MSNEVMHHIACKKGDIGKYVIVPGDPGRVEKIAKYLDNAKHIATKREYVTYTGYLDGVKVSVTSTGIGGPSASIAMEELVMCGADTFIRVGTCGGIDPELIPGNLIIATGAIRKDGTGREYVPIEFPAVANYDVVHALKTAADKLNKTSYLGIVECKDSYYGQHSPDRMPVGYDLKNKWNAWKMAGALGSEMESSTLFVVASTLRVRCGSILLLARNREREEKYNTGKISTFDTTPAIEVAIQAIRDLIASDISNNG
jgi:uridine phosphorylase